jgi:hypothetical protein
VSDLRRTSDELATKAALAAGRDAAGRAMDDLLSTDEEKAEKAATRDHASKSRRTKLIAYAVVGLLLVLGIVGFVLSYWQWFLLLGLAGVVGVVGWHRLRKRLKAGKGEPLAAMGSNEGRGVKTQAASEALLGAPRQPARMQAARGRQARDDARVRDELRTAEEEAVEEELAAMKARLNK